MGAGHGVHFASLRAGIASAHILCQATAPRRWFGSRVLDPAKRHASSGSDIGQCSCSLEPTSLPSTKCVKRPLAAA